MGINNTHEYRIASDTLTYKLNYCNNLLPFIIMTSIEIKLREQGLITKK